MLYFCSCFNSTFSSNVCDNIWVKQPEARSLASLTSLSLPRLRQAQLKWKVSVAGLCDPRATPCGFPQRWEAFSTVLPRPLTELEPLAKPWQSARDEPTSHSRQREEFYVDPTRTPFFSMSHQSALLCSAPQSECRQTLSGLCFYMPRSSC